MLAPQFVLGTPSDFASAFSLCVDILVLSKHSELSVTRKLERPGPTAITDNKYIK